MTPAKHSRPRWLPLAAAILAAAGSAAALSGWDGLPDGGAVVQVEVAARLSVIGGGDDVSVADGAHGQAPVVSWAGVGSCCAGAGVSAAGAGHHGCAEVAGGDAVGVFGRAGICTWAVCSSDAGGPALSVPHGSGPCGCVIKVPSPLAQP